jgi:hypothetical protein
LDGAPETHVEAGQTSEAGGSSEAGAEAHEAGGTDASGEAGD